jgi:hypothetical protein
VFLLSGTSRTSGTGSSQQSLPRHPNAQNLAAPLDSPQIDGGGTLVIAAHNLSRSPLSGNLVGGRVIAVGTSPPTQQGAHRRPLLVINPRSQVILVQGHLRERFGERSWTAQSPIVPFCRAGAKPWLDRKSQSGQYEHQLHSGERSSTAHDSSTPSMPSTTGRL